MASSPKSTKESSETVAIIGCGAMGSALARGIAREGSRKLVLYNRSREKVEQLARELQAKLATSPAEAAQDAQVVIVAVKPHGVSKVLREIRDVASKTSAPLLISVASAGSVDFMKARLGTGWRVARAIPNLPCLYGYGVSGVFASSAGDRETVSGLFRSVGEVIVVEDEAHLDIVTAVGGSGPAYVCVAVEAIVEGATRMGFPQEKSRALTEAMILGSVKLLQQSGEHPAAIKGRVASPGGTTLAGLEQLERGGFRGVLMAAIEAGAKRAREIRTVIESEEDKA